MKARSRQLDLRLDSSRPDPAARWHDGARVIYLGDALELRLSTDAQAAYHQGGVLHLPLPPAASPRQIQDAAEAWLRRRATHVIGVTVECERRRQARPSAPWALSFAARRSWFELHTDGSLRVNWRLIEQPLEVLENVVSRAVATLPMPDSSLDLWDFSAA